MSSEAVTQSDDADPMIGMVLDERYRIEQPLGQGGIGRVYKARHLILGRWVALKVLLAQYESIPVLQERFRREAEALASHSHPNIVTVTDFGVTEGMPYIVMELLEGQDLATLIDQEQIEPKRAFGIMRQVLRALAYAHTRELVHRDLKPHNVFVRALGDGTDHVVVLDFGLARFMGEAASRSPKLTRAGALIGTPAYMAPEQASGEPVDARADVYAAGLVFFETMTGRKPFDAKDPGEMLRAHLLVAPPRMVQADPGLELSEGLEGLVARSLSKSPTDRFKGAAEMLAALDALGPDAAKRVGPRPPRDHTFSGTEPTQVAMTRAATPGAVVAQRAARGPESSIALPKSKFPLFAGLGCAAGLLVGGAVAIAIVISSGGDDEGTATVVPAVTPTPAEDPVPAVAPVPTRPPAINPFAEELPPEIRRIGDAVIAGRRMSDSQYGALNRYARAHTDDVRGPLLIAHGHMNGRYLSGALPIYRDLLPARPEVRGDPRILPDLLELVRASGDEYHIPAANLIVDTYGSEAATAIVDMLQEDGLRDVERDHLLALDARIRAREPSAP
jgi:serine/threonine-protein kinase